MASEAEVLDLQQARERVARKEAVVLDIQDEDGWRRAHLVGATHAADGETEAAVESLPDDQPVVVVCRDGERSREVADKLAGDGRKAASIEGGMRSWVHEGFPVQPSEDPAPPRDECGDESSADES
jgi:rhodanese-related sulfurtransferase